MRFRLTARHSIRAIAAPLARCHAEAPLEGAAEQSLLAEANRDGDLDHPHICLGKELAGLDQLELSLSVTQGNAEMAAEQLIEMAHATAAAGGKLHG